jgi:hypothetical protein
LTRPGCPLRRLVAAGLVGICVVLAGQARADDPPRLAFSELYKSIGVLGLQFSDKVNGLKGKSVTMRGYMAPPLKPEADFFVMTREPVSLCPFCQTDADWPTDIVVVYLGKGSSLTRNTDPIEVTGTLEVGSVTDQKTGFVSLLRVVDARLRRL